ncbi:MAG: hypothetical protein H6719_25940 [Sandaracinaceae bacterium]|nr:hypothetical protein [Sandaracinaceae bacterium]
MADPITRVDERTWRWDDGGPYFCEARISPDGDTVHLYEGPKSEAAQRHEGGGNSYPRRGFPGNVHQGWKTRWPGLCEAVAEGLASP